MGRGSGLQLVVCRFSFTGTDGKRVRLSLTLYNDPIVENIPEKRKKSNF